jgi:threonine dehydrogenase-like Zn-dependent dehydrogenase
MSDFVCVDPNFVFKLPEHIGLDVGALVEPLAVAWHAVAQVSLPSRSTASSTTLVQRVDG